MITTNTGLATALSLILSKPVGFSMGLPANCANGIDLGAWCKENGLIHWRNGKTLTLQREPGSGETQREAFMREHPGKDMVQYNGGEFCNAATEYQFNEWVSTGKATAE